MKLEDAIKTIPTRISQIEKHISNWEEDINLNGKNIQTAIVEQPSLLARYDQLSVEASYLCDFIEMVLKKVRAERLKFIRDNASKDYTDTAIQKLIDGDSEYVKYYQIYLEVKEIYDKTKSIVESFRQRSYSLNNLVKVYENEIQNITIRME